MSHRREQHQPVVKSSVMEEDHDEEPLIDLTKALDLHSKKTERLQRRQKRKQEKAAAKRGQAALHLLPAELLIDVLAYLRPSDVLNVSSTCSILQQNISIREEVIAEELIRRQYQVLRSCFPRPVLLEDVDEKYHPALLSERRQKMLELHKRPYQHVKPHDQSTICSCLTCIFAWNNLNLIVDLHHWQNKLDKFEPNPIPMIKRGEHPQWNQDLVQRNSELVGRAIRSTIWYALILENHLDTTIRTMRRYCWYPRAKNGQVLYDMTDADIASGIDQFLERKGPPSYEFPYMRDQYFKLEAYMPNRRWDHEQKRWLYQPTSQHERDIEWAFSHHKDATIPSKYRDDFEPRVHPVPKDMAISTDTRSAAS